MVVLSLLIPPSAFAEETKKEETLGLLPPGTGDGESMNKPTPMGVPISGGMIVLAGNKLLKYDTDLNIVKEVEIPMSAGTKQSPLPKKVMEKDSVPVAAESQEETI